jgi:adenosylcobinamide-phosphate synthase
MSLEMQIILALLLDALLGDPRWLLHPVKMIGWLAMRAEKFFRSVIPHEKTAGAATVIAVLSISGSAGWWLVFLAEKFQPVAGDIVSILILYTCFAARDLIVHSGRVYKALQENDLREARERVGMIVGRDTGQLDEAGVVRAAVESVAENTVDGVTAPLFWAVVGGPVGALLYKAVNTLDSTFGYKNERYLHFGWASARLDDQVNWLPARITGLLMVAGAFLLRLRATNAWKILVRDRRNHSSPNSAWSEAPMAGALGIRLGGPTSYQGRLTKYPTMGDTITVPTPSHIRAASRLLTVTVVLGTLLFTGVRMMIL